MAVLKTYSASAGSGKTYTLAREVIDLLIKNPADYRHLLAVTFTNKATDEMKERIVRDLFSIGNDNDASDKHRMLLDEHVRRSGLAADEVMSRCRRAMRNILLDYGQFSVCTIDKFVQRVIRAFAYEQGLPANYGVQIDADFVLQNAVDDMMGRLHEKENDALKQHIVRFAHEKIVSGSKWTVDGEIMNLGKTLLSDKALFMTAENTLTLSEFAEFFKAIEEHRDNNEIELIELAYRLRNILNGVKPDDWNKNVIKKIFAGLERIDDLKDENARHKWIEEYGESFKDLSKKTKDKLFKKSASEGKEGVTDMVNDLGRKAGETLASVLTAVFALKQLNTLGIMTDLRTSISSIGERDNKLNLGSSGELLRALIDGCEIPFVYEKCGVRYDTIMIDEFQDTSRLQYENFLPLLRNSLAGGNDCLIVGDVKQSIYRFRNGDWRILAYNLDEHFGDLVEQRALSSNYRSRSEIVDFNNALFSMLPKIMQEVAGGVKNDPSLEDSNEAADDEVSEEREQGELVCMYNESRQNATRGKNGEVYVCVCDVKYSSKTQREAACCSIVDEYLQKVRYLHDDIEMPYSDICFLVRGKEDGEEIINILCENDFPVLSETSLFVMRSDATRGMVEAMRYICFGDDTPLFTAVKSYAALSVEELACRWMGLKEEWAIRFEQLRGLGIVELINELVNMLPEKRRRDDMPFIESLLQHARDAVREGCVTLDAFLRLTDDNEDTWAIEAPSSMDAIRVMTIHKSKGLEFRAVFIPSADWRVDGLHNIIWCKAEALKLENSRWNERMIPVSYSKELTNSYFAEDYFKERNLVLADNLNIAYVAFTRATEALYVWGINRVTKGESSSLGEMSRYIAQAIFDPAFDLPSEAKIESEKIVLDEDGQDAGEAKEPDFFKRNVYRCGSLQRSGTEKKDNAVDSVEVMEVELPLSTRPSESPMINSEVEPEEYGKRANMISYGLTMHGIFEHVRQTSDITDAVRQAVANGVLTADNAPIVEQEMTEKMADVNVKSWFDGSMVDVWAETTMAGPDRKLRPDRIMRDKDGRTIVADYKFGHTKCNDHIRQLQLYKEWLAEAGFNDVKASIWYYTLGEVVDI